MSINTGRFVAGETLQQRAAQLVAANPTWTQEEAERRLHPPAAHRPALQQTADGRYIHADGTVGTKRKDYNLRDPWRAKLTASRNERIRRLAEEEGLPAPLIAERLGETVELVQVTARHLGVRLVTSHDWLSWPPAP